MIITKKIKVEIKKGNLPRYKHLGIEIGDIIEIPLEDIANGSNYEIEAKCAFCGNIIKIQYKLYNNRIKKHKEFACSRKCSSIRNKKILRKKYNVDNISQVPYIKEKIKKTNLEKYGTEYYISSDDASHKRRETLIEKYGVDNPMKSNEIKEKVRQTNLERYGVECVLQNEEIRKNIEKTNLERYGYKTASSSDSVKRKIILTNNERYGYNSPMMNPNIIKKSRETLMSNYGVDNPQKSEKIHNKTKQTNLERYGVEYPTQSKNTINKRIENNLLRVGKEHTNQSEYHRKKFKMCKNENYIKYISEGVSLFKCDCNKNHNFEIHTDIYFSRIRNGVPLCTVCFSVNKLDSIKENELYKFIRLVYSDEIIKNYRNQLEIDIYLPELNLGFEFNGLYWHSEKYREKNYHIDKQNYFKERGIRIIYIWEDDWDNRRDIIKSQIVNLLGKSNRIFARKCVVGEIDNKKCSYFLNENHIQGSDKSVKKYGLYYEGVLKSVMTFNKFEGRKKLDGSNWNLSRFCNKLNTSVIGGASKLLKHFIKSNNLNRIVSYADKSWSNGILYNRLGFDLISVSSPDYKYVVNNVRKHKSNFKKSKNNSDLTESKFMKNEGYLKIWDCGKMKYELLI